ncbi:MAG: hypothetical protein NC331_16610 [Lachnospiraceae bacterium]|nr:hypothetical protein [Lachnospiraceae bacterium]MCM1240973.1 hypothetical protein [Lachnospiraceae bacterium]
MDVDKDKEAIFQAFTAKAVKRLQEKRARKYETLHIPSLDEDIRIQSLLYPEIVECTEIEDSGDPNRSDKYAIYLSVVEPDLKKLAVELKNQGEIREYTDIVDIFDMQEVAQIAMEVMKLSGVTGDKKVTVVSELKN